LHSSHRHRARLLWRARPSGTFAEELFVSPMPVGRLQFARRQRWHSARDPWTARASLPWMKFFFTAQNYKKHVQDEQRQMR
jgi:hypothetical protein